MPLSFGKHHVEQHDVGLHIVEPLHGLEPIGHRNDAKALAGQPDRQRFDEARLVFDHEHDRLSSHDSPAGSRIVNTEPSPSRECTVTSPE